jgi:hypothetical protein
VALATRTTYILYHLSTSMSIELSGLLALGVLNLALGLLIVFVCFRLSTLNKLVTDLEQRISRLEILTSLADSKNSQDSKSSKDSKAGQALMRKVGGTS